MIILTERHILHDQSFYDVCRNSGLLYNFVLYHVKQMYSNKVQKFTEYELSGLLAEFNQCDFRSLPSNVSQQVIKQVFQDVKRFFITLKDYKKNPKKYLGRPRFPKYKKGDKQNILTFTKQCFKVKDNVIKFAKNIIPNIKTKVPNDSIKQVRLIPQANCYVIEVVYEKPRIDMKLNKSKFISINLGLNNFVTAVHSNNVGEKPFIINGKIMKSFNHWYNKRKSKLMSFVGDKGTSKLLKNLSQYRNNWISDKIHKTSRFIINHCIQNDIGTIVIGHNKRWKNEINLGSRNNQKFVEIPHSKLIEQLKYKAQLVGIELIVTEESYTSKCDSLALEKLCRQETYLGQRTKRGLFKSSVGVLINADINGAINILRKVSGNVFILPCSGLALNPSKLIIA